jgi:hypothetical protein
VSSSPAGANGLTYRKACKDIFVVAVLLPMAGMGDQCHAAQRSETEGLVILAHAEAAPSDVAELV